MCKGYAIAEEQKPNLKVKRELKQSKDLHIKVTPGGCRLIVVDDSSTITGLKRNILEFHQGFTLPNLCKWMTESAKDTGISVTSFTKDDTVSIGVYINLPTEEYIVHTQLDSFKFEKTIFTVNNRDYRFGSHTQNIGSIELKPSCEGSPTKIWTYTQQPDAKSIDSTILKQTLEFVNTLQSLIVQ